MFRYKCMDFQIDVELYGCLNGKQDQDIIYCVLIHSIDFIQNSCKKHAYTFYHVSSLASVLCKFHY